jgi:AcrR family transcriptional regulator
MDKKTEQSSRLSARDRLLAAAGSLFYEEGFNTVGIDRVIERAGVAKASLYDCFGSKEELIRSYLASRMEARATHYMQELAKFKTPRDRLLGVFDVLGALVAKPTFRGCAFVKAGSDAKPDSSIKATCDESRQWMHDLFIRLVQEAGVRRAETLAQQFMMLYDGASIAAQLDRNPAAAKAARAAATAMLDAALAPLRGTK